MVAREVLDDEITVGQEHLIEAIVTVQSDAHAIDPLSPNRVQRSEARSFLAHEFVDGLFHGWPG